MVEKNLFYLKHIIVSFVLILCFGCTDGKLKNAVQQYGGDGTIHYRKGPILGKSGVLIQMEPMDLSLDQTKTYSLCRIPKGRNYIIYLVCVDPDIKKNGLNGLWTIRLRSGQQVIINESSKLTDTVESQTGTVKKYYLEKEGRFDVETSSCDFSLEIGWKTLVPAEGPLKAYIAISRGGYK